MSIKDTLEMVLTHISEAIKLLENNISNSSLRSYSLTGLKTARYAVKKLSEGIKG